MRRRLALDEERQGGLVREHRGLWSHVCDVRTCVLAFLSCCFRDSLDSTTL